MRLRSELVLVGGLVLLAASSSRAQTAPGSPFSPAPAEVFVPAQPVVTTPGTVMVTPRRQLFPRLFGQRRQGRFYSSGYYGVSTPPTVAMQPTAPVTTTVVSQPTAPVTTTVVSQPTAPVTTTVAMQPTVPTTTTVMTPAPMAMTPRTTVMTPAPMVMTPGTTVMTPAVTTYSTTTYATQPGGPLRNLGAKMRARRIERRTSRMNRIPAGVVYQG